MFKIKIDNNFVMNQNRSVLIIIDMIKGFTDVGIFSSKSIKNIAKNIRKFSDDFLEIIAINDKHSENDCEFYIYPKHCLKGNLDSEFCDELLDVDFKHVLTKNSTNGFFSSNFLEVIDDYIENGFDFIIVGCCTDICILQFCLTFKGYLNSLNKKLDVIVPIDLVETYDSENHPRDEVQKLSLYLMNNMGVKLIKSYI